MNGLRGMPFSYSSCTSELNVVPDGSRPMRVQSLSPSSCIAIVSVNTLEMLWIENFFGRIANVIEVTVDSLYSHADFFSRNMSQFGNVIGDLTSPSNGWMSVYISSRMGV